MNMIFPIFFLTISLTCSSNLTASGKMKINAVNCKKYNKHVSNFMKFEYGVTNGECVEKEKFGGQNLKKRQIVCRVLHPWHTAKFVFAMCQVQAHGKPRLYRVPNGRTRQKLTAWGGRQRGVSFCRVPCFCRVLLTAKAKYTVCLVFAVCLGWAHGKPGLCRVLLTANSRAHGKGRLSGSG